jgi:hypothetical protein
MPADISFDHASSTPVVSDIGTTAPRRLPLGIGLMFGACVSVGLWVAMAAGIRALLF